MIVLDARVTGWGARVNRVLVICCRTMIVFMTPSYIKALLGGTIIDKPIVPIWDGEKKDVVQNLTFPVSSLKLLCRN